MRRRAVCGTAVVKARSFAPTPIIRRSLVHARSRTGSRHDTTHPTLTSFHIVMDLLRNLGSAAVSSIVQKSGLNLPFSLGEKNAYFEGRTIWSLYDATKRVCSLGSCPSRCAEYGARDRTMEAKSQSSFLTQAIHQEEIYSLWQRMRCGN